MYHAGMRYCCGAVDVDMLARDGARSGCRCRVQLALASLAHAGTSNSLRWCDAYASTSRIEELLPRCWEPLVAAP